MTPIQRKIRILNLQDAIKAMRGLLNDQWANLDVAGTIKTMEEEIHLIKNSGYAEGYKNCVHDFKILRHSHPDSLMKCTKCPFTKFENY